MSKRFSSLIATASALAVTCALVLAGGASGAGGASALPKLNIALSGTNGVSVSGSEVSGAVNVVSTFSGQAPSGPNNGPAWGLIRLNPGVTVLQAAGAVQSHHGDLNALTPYGSLFADDAAPGAAQTVLTPGDSSPSTSAGTETLDSPRSPSPSPRRRPGCRTRRRPDVHRVRLPRARRAARRHDRAAQNGGFLVHMNIGIGVKNAATGRQVMALLRAGKDGKAQKLANRQFLALAGPLSPGGIQQAVLNAKPGYYVEACFMDTQDHREHTQLGMLRLIRVVK